MKAAACKSWARLGIKGVGGECEGRLDFDKLDNISGIFKMDVMFWDYNGLQFGDGKLGDIWPLSTENLLEAAGKLLGEG